MRRVFLLCSLGVLICSVSISPLAAQQRGADKAPNLPERGAVSQLHVIDKLLAAHKYAFAESLAKLYFEQSRNGQGNAYIARVALGKVELLEDEYEQAFRDLTWHWRVGREPERDLLVAMAGAQVSDHEEWRSLAKSALILYVNSHKDTILATFGGASFDYTLRNPGYTSGTGALLYACHVEDLPGLALVFANKADVWSPGRADIAYIRGRLEAKLNQGAAARNDLTYAALRGDPFLVKKAKDLLNSVKP